MEHLSIGKEAIIPIFLKFAPLGKVISSEVVVDTREMLKNSSFFTPCEGSRPTQQQVALEDGGATYIDMESRGIELVAQHFQLPRLLVKVPVDEVGEETKQFDRGVALEKLRNQVDYKGLIEKVVAYIHTLA
ncbi:MAG: hypothetical protein LBO09_02955 [Candidatus Peribacteria bacterium]|nr:hypothetical protein [Candidatus Peribacteria bacterium]